MKDDFETRSKYVASDELEFVNSWKDSPLCGDASLTLDPCSLNAFRHVWAERTCNIINSQTFAACHSQVGPRPQRPPSALLGARAGRARRAGSEGPFPQVYRLPYYEACLRDTCGCDTSGDCECLCDAVAAYAKACLDKGVCVDWRTPDFCRECPALSARPPACTALPGRARVRAAPPPGPAFGPPDRGTKGLTDAPSPSRLLRFLQRPHVGGQCARTKPGRQLHVALPAVPLPREPAERPGRQH